MREVAENSRRGGARNLENRARGDCLRKSLYYAAAMKKFVWFFAVILSALAAGAAELLPVEQQVAEAVKSTKVTVVHLWATWCPNCQSELKNGAWGKFIAANPEVNFVFVQVRDEKPATPALEKYGLATLKNLTHVRHPNPAHDSEDQMGSFLGMPVGWIPVTWIYRDGKLRYALNYGQVRFPILQQLVEDAQPRW
jgi:thiol-disulfide isomerase/thioredoxin